MKERTKKMNGNEDDETIGDAYCFIARQTGGKKLPGAAHGAISA